MSSVPFGRVARAAIHEARAFVRLDAVPSGDVLPGPALQVRRRRIEWSRHLVQAGFLATVLLVGWEFVRWVHGLEAGHVVGARPPGVEGFLPIAALLSLRHLLSTGEVHPVHPAGLVILPLVLATGSHPRGVGGIRGAGRGRRALRPQASGPHRPVPVNARARRAWSGVTLARETRGRC